MRKKQWKTVAVKAGRGFLLAAFCAAFLTVMLPAQSVSAGAAAVIPGENAVLAAGLSDLPPVGDKLIPLGRTTGIKLFSKGTMVVEFSKLDCPGRRAPCRGCTAAAQRTAHRRQRKPHRAAGAAEG